ncbi:MAG TPA: rhomboid family intramembrane serine protease [Clostridiales bacterium]|jgi:rhomboid protease GluP|nr:rhomboid family intramembrane serine protease [Clostridiales bacterium]
MNDDWRRDPNVIEGEYEIIGEWDAEEPRREPRRDHIEIGSGPPYVTYTILAINIGVWVLMSLVGFFMGWSQSQQLYYFGAKVNVLIAQGEYWRLLTPMFLHVGLAHLFFNSYALYIYGPAVERLFGRLKFILVYLVSGLVGSLLSYLLSPNNAAGASGAIFGLMGSLLYFRKEKRNLFQRVFGPGLLMIIGINLLYGFIQPGIDNWGHIGGLLGGFLMGNALGLYRERNPDYKRRIISWILIILIFVLGLGWGRLKYGASIHLNRALDAARLGRIDEAKYHIEKLSARARKDTRAKELIEVVYIEDINNSLQKGQTDEALESINVLIGYYPEEMNYYFYRGNIYEAIEDYERALEDYLFVTETVKNSDKVWFSAGRAAYNTGRLSDAKKYLEEALKINPNYQDAKQLLEDISGYI